MEKGWAEMARLCRSFSCAASSSACSAAPRRVRSTKYLRVSKVSTGDGHPRNCLDGRKCTARAAHRCASMRLRIASAGGVGSAFDLGSVAQSATIADAGGSAGGAVSAISAVKFAESVEGGAGLAHASTGRARAALGLGALFEEFADACVAAASAAVALARATTSANCSVNSPANSPSIALRIHSAWRVRTARLGLSAIK